VFIATRSKPYRIVRSRGQSIGLTLTGVFVALGFPLEALKPAGQLNLWIRGSFAVLGVSLGWFFIFRLARSGVFAYRDGVRILNPLGSRFVPWEETQKFKLGTWGLFPRMGYAELTNGSEHHIWGIQAPNPLFRPRNRSADRLIAELNELMRDHGRIS
jgi:hypothetical protein